MSIYAYIYLSISLSLVHHPPAKSKKNWDSYCKPPSDPKAKGKV